MANNEELDNEDTETQKEGIIAELNRSTAKEFNLNWGWIDIAMNVSKETQETFFQTMDRNVMEVLSIALYLMDKVELIKIQSNGSAKF